MTAQVVRLQETSRLRTRATIKRASAKSRAAMNALDRRYLDDLDRMYRQAAADLQAAIRSYAGTDGSVRLAVLRDLLAQVNTRIDQLGDARNRLLDGGLVEASELGARPFAEFVGASGSITRVADEAARFVRTFVAKDGLQLSDRLWRLDRGARDGVARAIESAVIQGHSASQAASEFLSRGQPVPPDVAGKLAAARADGIATSAASALLTGDGNPRANALRLMRTELNRAHGETYRRAAFEHPDAIGTRFLLSPNHPAPDICDMHASVNRYGLGPGVYPKGKSPWPAHPNTLSYEEVVFADEVSDDDRNNKQDRLAWLKEQPPHVQEGVLGSRKKRAALQQGLLRESQIDTPWHVLKQRYERQGIDTDALTVRVEYPLTAPPTAVAIERRGVEARNYVREQGLKTGFEHAVVYDINTGAEFFRKTSRRTSYVAFDRHEMTVMMDARRALELVHNHPSSTSLSVPDLQIAAHPGVARIIAVGHDGTTYLARSLVGRETIRESAEIIERALYPLISQAVNTRFLTVDQANVLNSHARNTVLHRLQLIDYRVETPSRAFTGTMSRYTEEGFEKLVEIARERVIREYMSI